MGKARQIVPRSFQDEDEDDSVEGVPSAEDQYPPLKSFLLPSDPPSPPSPIHSQVNVSSHTFLRTKTKTKQKKENVETFQSSQNWIFFMLFGFIAVSPRLMSSHLTRRIPFLLSSSS